MKLIIDIPEEVKQKIDENLNSCDLDIYDCVMLATKKGIPLPKGHGRLIDADAVNKKMKEREEKLQDDRSMWEGSAVSVALDMFAPTIIEADNERIAELEGRICKDCASNDICCVTHTDDCPA